MFAVIRIKGDVDLNNKRKTTLRHLRLFSVNHLALVQEKPNHKKMINLVLDLVTFGEIQEDALALLLEKRAKLKGDKALDAEFLKKNKFASFLETAKAIIAGKTTIETLGIKPVFRLHAPIKGYERAGIKKSYSVGGASGYRAQDINALIKRMT